MPIVRALVRLVALLVALKLVGLGGWAWRVAAPGVIPFVGHVGWALLMPVLVAAAHASKEGSQLLGFLQAFALTSVAGAGDVFTRAVGVGIWVALVAGWCTPLGLGLAVWWTGGDGLVGAVLVTLARWSAVGLGLWVVHSAIVVAGWWAWSTRGLVVAGPDSLRLWWVRRRTAATFEHVVIHSGASITKREKGEAK